MIMIPQATFSLTAGMRCPSFFVVAYISTVKIQCNYKGVVATAGFLLFFADRNSLRSDTGSKAGELRTHDSCTSDAGSEVCTSQLSYMRPIIR